MNALLLHPHDNVSGNILWPIRPSDDDLESITLALMKIRALGYWASPFPEGDGITFNKDYYRPEAGLVDFRKCFDFIEFHEPSDQQWGTSLGALAEGASITATCLVPVTNFLLLETFSIGKTTFHAPVDGIEVQLLTHRWGMELCDVSGADVIPNWAPDRTPHIGNLAALLGYPLIEREILIPAKILYDAQISVSGQERLLNFVAQDADRALDLLRWAFCSYKKLEYLPNKAGWIDDFSFAYIIPSFGPKANIYSAKPSVLRVENNWLGLEVQFNPDDSDISALADIVDGVVTNQMAKEVKSALRTIGQAYYLIEPEASFLSLIYALDALCEVGNLRGPHQRVWVSAAANGKVSRFGDLLSEYNSLYEIRNRIVHDGETFSSLETDAHVANQQIQTILCLVILNIVGSKSSSRSDFVNNVLGKLQKGDYISAINNWNPKDIKCPLHVLTDDKTFSWVVGRRSTYRKD